MNLINLIFHFCDWHEDSKQIASTPNFFISTRSSKFLARSFIAIVSTLFAGNAYAESQFDQLQANSKDNESLIQAVSRDPMIFNTSDQESTISGESKQINQDINYQDSDKSALGASTVSQLSDVRRTDWAFTALESLIERYGFVTGYLDGTFQGNRALTRYEFSTALNLVLERVNRSVPSTTTNLVNKEDLTILNKLQQEFAAELATIRGQVDELEGRTNKLEMQEFSPTTKLYGQAVFGVQGRLSNQADLFPRDGIKETSDPGTNVNVISSVQLTLLTQFKNRSFLLTGIQAGNGSTFPGLTNNMRLAYESPTSSSFVLSDLTYRFLIGDKFAAYVGAAGVNPVTAFRGPNRVAMLDRLRRKSLCQILSR